MSGAGAHLRALARLALQGIRSRGAPPPPAPVPRRRVAVEVPGIRLEARRIARYLRATGGEGIAAFRGEEAVVSPTYPATWETTATLELLARLETPLPAGGVVHLESETFPLRLFRPGDRVRCRVELERVEPTPRGLRLAVSARHWNGSGQLCAESSALFLLRARDGAAPPRGPRADPPPPLEEGWEEVARWTLGSGAGRRYARASGDYNPIHLWALTARPFGFRRPILHGFCTEALVAHALIEHRFGGDPAALRRLRIAFRAPLLLPRRVRLLVRGPEGAARVFRVAEAESGRVLAEGEYVGG